MTTEQFQEITRALWIISGQVRRTQWLLAAFIAFVVWKLW